jgi:hypothetical protein
MIELGSWLMLSVSSYARVGTIRWSSSSSELALSEREENHGGND